MVDVQTVVAIGGGVTGIVAAALTVGVTVGRPLRRLARQNDEFRVDWYGAPARPGRAPIPGVPERLARIEAELQPDHGSSLRDAVNRVEARLSEHINGHSHQT
ncbi:hypothetical protein O7627_24465 [Solwaraspora sp. WMMD1047]|uniref:hypothetical protein n=1 Tax=Solwaraspora sp. WMMD1047 TaxID=3016102 RepID=UPI0024161267|nr:hypothetical protein [Solwaraspora sp. WMMD1047]MDG4832438.1 hypothetical protein [Solwaraspora sp. WMMD1047]